MSKYATFEVEFKDEKTLVSALKMVGCEAEVHGDAVPLNGYEGTTEGKLGHVVVRRSCDIPVFNLGDLGFFREPSGRYAMIADDFQPKVVSEFLGKLKQAYGESRALSIAKQRGYILTGREIVKTPTGQRVQLRFAAR